MMSLRTVATGALLAALAATGSARAQSAPSPWTLRLGPAHVGFSTQASVTVAGNPVPGGDASASSNTTLGFELSYDLAPRWTARLLAGIPPRTTLTGTGALAGTGTLGKVTYGPAAATLTYHLLDDGPVRPYLGAGVNYTIVFRSEDGFISNLNAHSAFGSVLQAGVEVPVSAGWTLTVDARKIFVKTRADGVLPALGGAPAQATVRLDPLVVFVGLGTRF